MPKPHPASPTIAFHESARANQHRASFQHRDAVTINLFASRSKCPGSDRRCARLQGIAEQNLGKSCSTPQRHSFLLAGADSWSCRC